MAKLKFQIVTPERVVIRDQEVDAVICPTTTGQITILPGHAPLISSLDHGELIAKINGRIEHIAVSGGFVEVRLGNDVVILADTAERAEEIDEQRAEEAKLRAQESMKNRHILSEEEYAKLSALLQRNLIRLKVAKRHSKHGRHVDADTNVT